MSRESSPATPPEATGSLREPVAGVSALGLPERPGSRWHRAGVSRRVERILDRVGAVVLALFVAGWVWSFFAVRSAEAGEVGLTPATGRIVAGLTHADAPSTAYLTDAAINAFAAGRGISGKLRVAVTTDSTAEPDSLPPGARVVYSQGGDVGDTTQAPARPGVWKLAIAIGNAIRPVTDFSLIRLRPASENRGGRVGLYFLGSWPKNPRAPSNAPAGKYAPPVGYIEVTPQNEDTYVSQHFRLRDFLTHNQANVWPKYLVLRLELVDKLELVLDDLAQRGVDVSGVHVMSGFRTPNYNATGGNTAGRASLSRHMYGDAADIFIDSDGNGVMDDLNHDGRSTPADAKVIQDAVDRVERAHPELIGGAGVYTAAPGHGPFIHIDTRGYRARWTGTSGG